MRLILASASPRRAELLRAAGYRFDVIPADVDERPRPGEAPHDYVARVATDKAACVAHGHPNACVLGADTTVVVDGTITGKPNDVDEARAMLERLSGRTHEILTGVACWGEPAEPGSPRSPRQPGKGGLGGELGEGGETGVEVTEVRFLTLTEAEIEWYLESGEWEGKAGAYAIQGLASRFIDRLHGSYSNVVGLPVTTVTRMLGRFGSVGSFV